MIECESWNKYHQNMCWREIGLRDKYLLTIVDTIVIVIGRGGVGGITYMINSIAKRAFTLTMNWIFAWAPTFMRRVAKSMIWICRSSHTNFISISYTLRNGLSFSQEGVLMLQLSIRGNGWGKPTSSYKWTGWVWKITSSSLRLHEICPSF